MKKSVGLAVAAGVACIGLAAWKAQGQAVRKPSAVMGQQTLRQLARKMRRHRLGAVGQVQAQSARPAARRSPDLYLQFSDQFGGLLIQVDNDASGDYSAGDILMGSGPVTNVSGQNLGFWDGSFVLTDDNTTDLGLTHISLALKGQGAVDIGGRATTESSPFVDTDRFRVPAAPITGAFGSVASRYQGAAAFLGFDDNDALVMVLQKR